ncbi:unnamed protein product [Phytophthora fragariaefolia]|uniref:Unnamed protein product n=1 Tax=Phytophthora fragariaefolia TaxID=1490495 RepID=A0A9W6YQU8_9STRA|nr:unnamed protein product [Phytophthora fragariaefolia]
MKCPRQGLFQKQDAEVLLKSIATPTIEVCAPSPVDSLACLTFDKLGNLIVSYLLHRPKSSRLRLISLAGRYPVSCHSAWLAAMAPMTSGWARPIAIARVGCGYDPHKAQNRWDELGSSLGIRIDQVRRTNLFRFSVSPFILTVFSTCVHSDKSTVKPLEGCRRNDPCHRHSESPFSILTTTQQHVSPPSNAMMAPKSTREIITWHAYKSSIKAGSVTGIVAGATVLSTNKYWPAFRSRLGVSGKTALTVMPTMAVFSFVSENCMLAGAHNPQMYLASMDPNFVELGVPKQNSLKMYQRVANYLLLAFRFQQVPAAVAPNELLGTCFDDEWDATISASLAVSATDRDSAGALINPYLHKALCAPRFQVNDVRTARARDELFQPDCMPSDSVFYGVGARVDNYGNVINPGRINGTLVLEIDTWTSHSLSTMILAILAQELVRK